MKSRRNGGDIKCCICDKTKNQTNFCKNGNKGYKTICRKCHAEREKERRKNLSVEQTEETKRKARKRYEEKEKQRDKLSLDEKITRWCRKNICRKNNQNSGAAYIEKGPSLLFIRTEGLALNIEEIGTIFIAKSASGTPIYIRDVADVRIGSPIRYGALTYQDQGEVSGAVVLMLKGENASQVIHQIEKKILFFLSLLIAALFALRSSLNHFSCRSRSAMPPQPPLLFVLVWFRQSQALRHLGEALPL